MIDKIARDAEKRLMGGVVVVHYFGVRTSLVFRQRGTVQCLWCSRIINVEDLRQDREAWVENPKYPDEENDVVRCTERADDHY